MNFDKEYNVITDNIIIFRDNLNYTLDEVVNILKNVCDEEIIIEIYNDKKIAIINKNDIDVHHTNVVSY
jgi:hypothetical protein